MSTTKAKPLKPVSYPRIGITIGDAAGIGPEIVLRSLFGADQHRYYQPIVIGDGEVLRRTAESVSLNVDLEAYEPEASGSSDVRLIDLKNLSDRVRPGEESAETGRASGEYIEKAVRLWRDGEIDAIATAPISKKALNAGGYDYPGHTEFLAELTATTDFAMSFFADKLRVVLLSTHLPLVSAIDRVTRANLVKLIDFSNVQLAELLKRRIKIAVAGLNPHASEGGMFGTEEACEMTPAIEYCRNDLGIDVQGPFSPDTICLRGYRGEFDAVLACYHDQATIAVKSLSFGSAVNVTLGLPLIRTSVDHGTATDIAGRGIADASSMTAAIDLAAELASVQRQAVGTG
jgi:4-hydroxythreonine-4-phosphate dehydrogenase